MAGPVGVAGPAVVAGPAATEGVGFVRKTTCAWLALCAATTACDLAEKKESAPAPVCASREPQVCFERAMRWRDSHPGKAEQAFDIACRAALPAACNNLALLYMDPPKGIRGDLERAALLFDLACKHDVAQSCHGLANMHARGQHVAQDDGRALTLWKKACAMGHYAGCDAAGTALANGRGIKADKKAAMVLWEKACSKGGVPHACAAVGLNVALGIDGVKRDEKRGAQLLLAACNSDYAAACKDLGGLHLAKLLPDADQAKGLLLLRNACNLAYGDGCNELGVAHAQGIGTQRAPSQAVKLFERACGLRSLDGCANLAVALEHGDGTTQDLDRADALYDKACTGGHRASCKRLGKEPPAAVSGSAAPNEKLPKAAP